MAVLLAEAVDAAEIRFGGGRLPVHVASAWLLAVSMRSSASSTASDALRSPSQPDDELVPVRHDLRVGGVQFRYADMPFGEPRRAHRHMTVDWRSPAAPD